MLMRILVWERGRKVENKKEEGAWDLLQIASEASLDDWLAGQCGVDVNALGKTRILEAVGGTTKHLLSVIETTARKPWLYLARLYPYLRH